MEFKHKPIMLNEVLSGLEISPDGIYIDCTVGGAGHSIEIAKKLSNKGKLICIDKDEDALKVAKQRLADYNNIIFVKSDFKQIKDVLNKLDIFKLNGVLIDLGVSSYQLDNPERGFSFRFDSELDMRMDREQALTAYDVVNNYSEKKLIRILREYGEEEFAVSIVKNIIKMRPIKTTKQLAAIIEKSMPTKVVFKRGGAHKKTFQAIRIEVNKELELLFEVVNYLISILDTNGTIAILTFHSLEDRIIKNAYRFNAQGCICPPKTPICICNNNPKVVIVNKKPITASVQELKDNSRASSAKLRVAKKL